MFFQMSQVHFNNHQKVKDYFHMWLKYNNRTMDESQFPGIKFEDITDIEKCFNIKVLIYNLNSNGTVTCVYETMPQNLSKMYLNISQSLQLYDKFSQIFQEISM